MKFSEIGLLVHGVTKQDPASRPEARFDYIDLSSVNRFLKTIEGPANLPSVEAPSRARQLVQTGDVLVATVRPNLNAVAGVPPELDGSTASTGFTVLRAKAEQLDPAYLLHWVRSDRFVQEMVRLATGASYPAVSDKVVKKSLIPLVPLDEQKRIASILDAADTLRTKRQQAIEQLDTLTQAIFHDMFGNPLSNPRGWSTVAISELGAVSTGKTPSGLKDGMYGSEVPFVTPGDLESMETVARWLSKEGASQVRVVPAGSAMVCCIGTIGKVGLAHRRSAFNQQINAVDWDRKKVVPNYGFQVLRLFSPEIARHGSSTTVPILKKSSFEKLQLPCPPRELQEKYSTLLDALTLRRVQAVEQIAQFDSLFTSLQQRAFRGDL